MASQLRDRGRGRVQLGMCAAQACCQRRKLGRLAPGTCYHLQVLLAFFWCLYSLVVFRRRGRRPSAQSDSGDVPRPPHAFARGARGSGGGSGDNGSRALQQHGRPLQEAPVRHAVGDGDRSGGPGGSSSSNSNSISLRDPGCESRGGLAARLGQAIQGLSRKPNAEADSDASAVGLRHRLGGGGMSEHLGGAQGGALPASQGHALEHTPEQQHVGGRLPEGGSLYRQQQAQDASLQLPQQPPGDAGAVAGAPQQGREGSVSGRLHRASRSVGDFVGQWLKQD